MSHTDLMVRTTGRNDRQYYRYDGNGQRVCKITERWQSDGRLRLEQVRYLNGVDLHETWLLPAEQAQTLNEEAGQVISWSSTLKIQTGNTTVAVSDYQDGRREQHFRLGDRLGSSQLELDVEARLISYEEYFPFGGNALIAGRARTDAHLSSLVVLRKHRL